MRVTVMPKQEPKSIVYFNNRISSDIVINMLMFCDLGMLINFYQVNKYFNSFSIQENHETKILKRVDFNIND